MLPTPAESGPERAESPGSRTAADSGLMAAPVAGAVDISPRRLAEARIQHRGCFARPLPLDRTCSAVARRFFSESVAGLGLPADLVHDGITMASELAANTLHADGNVEFRTQSQRPVSGCPEFWLYVRGEGPCGPHGGCRRAAAGPGTTSRRLVPPTPSRSLRPCSRSVALAAAWSAPTSRPLPCRCSRSAGI